MVLRTIAKHSYDSTLFYIRSNYSGLTPVYAPEASTAGLLDWQKNWPASRPVRSYVLLHQET